MGPPIPLYEPIEDGTNDNVFLSKSYDATSHFETTTGKFTITKSALATRSANVILQMTSRTSTGGPRARTWSSRA